MERLRERLAIAYRALGTLEELLRRPEVDAVVRDASLQRFEYTFEAVWKLAQRYLQVFESIEVASPKGVIRSSFQVSLLDETQTRVALAMADDRNLTTHTYNEALADRIYEHLVPYAQLMRAWVEGIEARLSEPLV